MKKNDFKMCSRYISLISNVRKITITLSVALFAFSLSMCSHSDSNHHPLPRFYSGVSDVPVSGNDYPGVGSYDTQIKRVMVEWNIPGAVIALAKNGKLILARGYGYSDWEAGIVMRPDSMMRIGSTSKTITSLAILHLRDEGKLDIDSKFMDLLPDMDIPENGDQRIRMITIRHLLCHMGGWDRSISGDPINDGRAVEKLYGLASPPSRNDTIRYALTKRLDFNPGERGSYSNLGYLILGSVIEEVSGEPYKIYVRDNVLSPMGIHAMSIGYEHREGKGPYETAYYDPWSDESLFPGEGSVPRQYGWTNLNGMDSAGGWVSSAIDLTRIMTAIDGSRMPGFLSADSMAKMIQNPVHHEYTCGSWYGFGLFVGPTNQQWHHGGSLPGTQCDFYRLPDGYVWSVITNSRSEDPDGFSDALYHAMTDALGSGLEGSSDDLYSKFPSPILPSRH